MWSLLALHTLFPAPTLLSACIDWAHLRRRLPPTFVPGRRRRIWGSWLPSSSWSGSSRKATETVPPSARRGGRSWWPVVGEGLGNKARQELQLHSCSAQGGGWCGRCTHFSLDTGAPSSPWSPCPHSARDPLPSGPSSFSALQLCLDYWLPCTVCQAGTSVSHKTQHSM